MFDSKIEDKLKYIDSEFIQKSKDKILLKETNEDGKANLEINIKNSCIAFNKLDEHRMKFFTIKNCADDIIFEYKNNKWILHIIELKKTVKMKEWSKIKKQFEGGYLNAIAIAGYLGIEINEIILYTAYRKENLIYNPIELRANVGKQVNAEALDWINGEVVLNLFDEKIIRHNKILLDYETGEGSYSI